MFKIGGIIQKKATTGLFNVGGVQLPTGASFSVPVEQPNIQAETELLSPFNLEFLPVENEFLTTFSLVSSVEAQLIIDFSLTTAVENELLTRFNLNEFNIAEATLETSFVLIGDVPIIDLPIDAIIEPGGVGQDWSALDIISADISQDEDSWTWNFNAGIADQHNWEAVKPENGGYSEIIITVRGTSFNLMIEGIERSRQDVTSTWKINGRGITAKLDGKYASGVSDKWRKVNAKDIIQGLCSQANIVLDYQAVDWQINELDGEGRYPIEIINEIANAIGAVVQTSPDGTLIVRHKFSHKPSEYAQTTPDFIITDNDDYVTLDERWDNRDNYNVVSVGDDEVDEIAGESNLSISSSDIEGSSDKQVRIFAVPFIADITLEDSAEGALQLIYQGIHSEELSEEAVEIIKGEGSVSKPFYSLISSDYIHSDLGAITISESGDIKTAVEGQSLMNISYTTKFHQYLAIRQGDDKYLQVFLEVEE
ncbi:MAG: hypothetical protein DRQ62_15460 [Gammaproteobacteria bacterium]|nr:MAG: hypothetical protein DRQ62_15460 [Gammaproteobacteria bacterium]